MTTPAHRPRYIIDLLKNSSFLFFFFALSLSFSSCKTIAYYDDNTFVKTAELKAKTLVLISHSNEDFKDFRNQVDDILIMAETIYAMQKARELNYLTVKQWDVMMKGTGLDKKSMLSGYFDLWKKKGKLNDFFIDEQKDVVGKAFDEILKLEEKKLRK